MTSDHLTLGAEVSWQFLIWTCCRLASVAGAPLALCRWFIDCSRKWALIPPASICQCESKQSTRLGLVPSDPLQPIVQPLSHEKRMSSYLCIFSCTWESDGVYFLPVVCEEEEYSFAFEEMYRSFSGYIYLPLWVPEGPVSSARRGQQGAIHTKGHIYVFGVLMGLGALGPHTRPPPAAAPF